MRRIYCNFNIWPNDLVLRVALSSGITFTKFDLQQLIRAWIIAFFDADTLGHTVTLTFDPLTLKVPGTWKGQSLYEFWAKSSNRRLNYWQFCKFLHMLSRCHLDLWLLDLELLQHFGCHAFKVCTKFERNRIIHGRVVDDLTRFWNATLGGGAFLPNSSQGCVDTTSPNLKFVSAFGYLGAFSNAGASNFSDVENDAKFCTFWSNCDN